MNANALRWAVGAAVVAALLLWKRDAIMSGAKELIAGEEGLRLTVYQDTGGVWTVGYGHVVKPSDGLYPYTSKRTITQAEADEFFRNDTAIATAAVKRNVRVPISENQRSALISLTFNIGGGALSTSTLLRKLNAGDIRGAADEFLKWVYDNGVRVAGLEDRRKRERALFLS